ncbi:MAG: hypothetical protein NZ455_10475 [Bacteroidia bacterium]|nr:hypothetical protein [Bacteroidia bacterium]MDW8346219.1 hypothetical protein [Bacteroidia bacterium]
MRRVRKQCAAPKRKRSPQHADPSAAKGHAQKSKISHHIIPNFAFEHKIRTFVA